MMRLIGIFSPGSCDYDGIVIEKGQVFLRSSPINFGMIYIYSVSLGHEKNPHYRSS